MKVFVDTSIFVDCLRSNPVSSSKDFLESIEGENSGFTSTIVVAELSVGAYLSQRADAIEKTFRIISAVSIPIKCLARVGKLLKCPTKHYTLRCYS